MILLAAGDEWLDRCLGYVPTGTAAMTEITAVSDIEAEASMRCIHLLIGAARKWAGEATPSAMAGRLGVMRLQLGKGETGGSGESNHGLRLPEALQGAVKAEVEGTAGGTVAVLPQRQVDRNLSLNIRGGVVLPVQVEDRLTAVLKAARAGGS